MKSQKGKRRKKSLEEVIFGCASEHHNGIDSIIVSEAEVELRILDWLRDKTLRELKELL